MMKRTLFITTLLILLGGMVAGWGVQKTLTVYAQDDTSTNTSVASDEEETACTQLTTFALEMVDQLCQSVGRNQACYGNLVVDAEPRVSVEDFTFSKAGDITSVAEIQSLRLGGLDIVKEEWGVALMRLQANLPDTLPGQNVTFLLFGDVQLDNLSGSGEFQVMTVERGLNVRLAPSDTAPILGSFAAGTQIEAAGRYGNWIQVRYAAHPGLTGWVNADLIDGDVAVLPEVDVRSRIETPMQSVYFTGGVGEPQCEDAPRDGLLVQSPKGLGLVRFNVNGVEVQMGSTAYLNFENDTLFYTLIEGRAFVSANGVIQRVYPGQSTHIQMVDGQPAGGPSYPRPYEAEPLDFLRPMLEMMPDPISFLPAPLEAQSREESDREIAAFMLTSTAPARMTATAIAATRTQIAASRTPIHTPTRTPIRGATVTATDMTSSTLNPPGTLIGTPSPTRTPITPTATPTATDVLPTSTSVIPTETPTEVPPTDVPPTEVPPTDVPPTDERPTLIPPTDVPTDVLPTDTQPTDPLPPTTVPPTDIPPNEEMPPPCPFKEDVPAIAVFVQDPSHGSGAQYDLYLLDKDCREVYVDKVRGAKPKIFMTHVSRVWIVRDARNNTELLRWTPTIGGEFTIWLNGGTRATEEPPKADEG